MTHTALIALIREQLGFSEDSPAITATRALIDDSKSDLLVVVGMPGAIIAVCDPGHLGIQDMEQLTATLKEYPGACFFVDRAGRARAVDRVGGMAALWLRVIERTKRSSMH